jgi:hypothetical protein
VPLEGHWQRQHASRDQDSPRERRVLLVITGVLCSCALAVGIAILALGSGSKAPGCIDLSFASTMGAAGIHVCGDRAARVCDGRSPVAYAELGDLRRRCREAGF